MLPHPIVAVTAFRQIAPYTLVIEFDDGASQTIDFSPVLYGRLYGPLRDPEFKSESILIFPRWFGQTMPILTRRRCGTGENTCPICSNL